MSTFRTVIQASAQGEKVYNVLHLGEQDPDSEQDAAARVLAAWQTHILPMLSNVYTLEGVECTNITTDNQAGYAPAGGGAVGGATGPALPTFVCMSVRVQSARRGRAGQGRFGVSPLPEGATSGNGNTIDSGVIGTSVPRLNSFFNAVKSTSTAGPAGGLAIVSLYKGVDAAGKPVKRPAPLVTMATGLTVNSVLGTRLSRHPNR